MAVWAAFFAFLCYSAERDIKALREPNLQRTKIEIEISPLLKNFCQYKMPSKVDIEYQDQFGYWKHYQTKYHEQDAYRTAKQRAKSTGKRHRIVKDGMMVDICEP